MPFSKQAENLRLSLVIVHMYVVYNTSMYIFLSMLRSKPPDFYIHGCFYVCTSCKIMKESIVTYVM